MAFADALDILGGGSSAPATMPAAPAGAPLQITVRPKGVEAPAAGFGGALDILSSDQPPEAPKEQRKVGGMESFYSGLKSGVSGNFSDEIQGVNAAGRTMLPKGINPSDLPLNLGEILTAGAGAARLGYEALTGEGEGTKAYREARDKERETQRLAAEQHPVANIAGNVAGALALPIGGAAEATTLAGRTMAGAGLGAGMGAVYGAGEGQGFADRATRAGTGALIGGTVGAVAPPLLAGVGKVGGAISDTAGRLLGHPLDTLRGIRNPDEEAARRIGTALKSDIEAGRPGMGASDLRAADATGQPTAVIDVGGENTRALGRSAANTSPQARAALEGMSQDRFNAQNQRVPDFVRSLVPTPGNAFKTQEAIDAAEVAANRGGYARAYAAGDRPINSPELERLMGSPDVVRAMKVAAEKGKSRAVADGFGAFNPGVKVTDDGRVLFQKGANGIPTYPNIQFWDYTYRALRDEGKAAFRAGRNDEGSYLSSLANQMRSELDRAVPEYGTARGIAASFFQAENALEAGQKFVGMRVPMEEAKAAYAKMTPAQKTLFAEGFASDLADKVSKISDNRSVTIDRIFNSPDGRARIDLALGKDKAQDLEMFLRRENMMDLVRKSLGNSTTARQYMELGLAGGLSGVAGGTAEAMMTGNMDAKSLLSAAVVGGAVAGHRAINFKVAQRVGEMLASNDPKVLGTAIRMIKTNPDAKRAVIRAEKMLEKLSGQSAGSAPPMLPAVGAGRADQEQQQ